MSNFKGTHHHLDLRFIQEPDASDYIELQAEISAECYGPGTVSKAQIVQITEVWQAMDSDQRRAAWGGALDTLQRAVQTRAQSRA